MRIIKFAKFKSKKKKQIQFNKERYNGTALIGKVDSMMGRNVSADTILNRIR